MSPSLPSTTRLFGIIGLSLLGLSLFLISAEGGSEGIIILPSSNSTERNAKPPSIPTPVPKQGRFDFRLPSSHLFSIEALKALLVPHASLLPPDDKLGTAGNRTLGFSSIRVAHLARRVDRFETMETLASRLHLDFRYVESTDDQNPIIDTFLHHVRLEREQEGWCGYVDGCENSNPGQSQQAGRWTFVRSTPPLLDYIPGHLYYPDSSSSLTWRAMVQKARRFHWERDSMFLPDAYALQQNPTSLPLAMAGADLWTKTPLIPSLPPSPNTLELLPVPAIASYTTQRVLEDGSDGAALEAYNRRPSRWRRRGPLARAAVACWKSHTDILRDFVETQEETMLVLEDDIDMESDIKARMEIVHAALPADWDIVLLGHCWGQESTFEPISPNVTDAVRPSYAPKCSHAYGVSRNGALRMLRHLRSPAFAYSRPYDHAVIQLVATQRLRSFSVVPSVLLTSSSLQALPLPSGPA